MTTGGGKNIKILILGIVLTTIGVVLIFRVLWGFSCCQSVACAGDMPGLCMIATAAMAGITAGFLIFGVLFLIPGLKTELSS
jgi:hypothetical protein